MELNDFEKLFVESVTNIDIDEQRHIFSLRYKIRKRKIIRDYEHSFDTQVSVRRFRPKYIIIAIVLSAVLTACGFGVYKIIEGFRMREYDIYSMLYIDEGYSQGLSEIEKKFYIDMDMSEYEVNVIYDDFNVYWLEYKKDDIIISICQVPCAIFDGTSLNTENANSEPRSVSLNGWNGLYFQLQNEGYYFIFNTEEYVISYTCNMSKEFIHNMVIMTKFR